jgi:ERF superfamily
MSVYKKLIKARNMLRKLELKKSGHNKFAGYNYFELGDFLPYVQAIFEEVGLCDVIYFDKDMAYMNIYDTEDGSFATFTSPMGSAQLKGCHEVQNIGAVETYQRRYLYVTAMAISEHDALDATTGAIEPVKKEEPPKKIESPKMISKIEGDKGEFQIIVDPVPEGNAQEWLDLVQQSSHMLLDLCEKEADVMAIFRKNKVLFDTVKAKDPEFFAGMMGKFTLTKEKLKERK